MFGNRYFAPRYFADRYYPPVAILVPPEPEQPAVAGGVRFFAPRAVRGWARVVAPAAECRITAQVVAPAILSAECRAPAALLDGIAWATTPATRIRDEDELLLLGLL
jgi:hypothetical protein